MNAPITLAPTPGPLHATGEYHLSIVLPRLHEPREVIKSTLRRISHISESISLQVIIVNDGGDPSELIGLDQYFPRLRIIHNLKCRGKGYSVRRGVSQASGRYIFYSDIDLPIGLTDLVEALPGLQVPSRPQMLVGQRVQSGSTSQTTSNSARRVTSKLFRRVFKLLIHKRVSDSQCPFKLIERKAARRLFGLSCVNGYAFDAELIFLAQQLGIELVQKNIAWTDTRAPWALMKSLNIFLRMTTELLLIRLRGTLTSSRIEGEREEIEQECLSLPERALPI